MAKIIIEAENRQDLVAAFNDLMGEGGKVTEEKAVRKLHKDEDDEEKPARRSSRKDDEDEKPARKPRKDHDDEDEKPARRSARKNDDDEEDKPKRRASRANDDDEEKDSKAKDTKGGITLAVLRKSVLKSTLTQKQKDRLLDEFRADSIADLDEKDYEEFNRRLLED